jgi:beta-lactamase regulating signal transducer with metallopeptidase domain
MNTYPLTTLWLQILAVLAVEVGLVALLFAAVQRRCRTATWQRTLCEAALVTSVVVAFSELSGTGRGLMAQVFSTNPVSRNVDRGDTPHDIRLQPNFRSEVMNQLAQNQMDGSIPEEGAKIASISPEQAASLISEKIPATNHRLRMSDIAATQCLAIILGLGAAFVAGRACLGRLILALLGSRRKAIADRELLRRVEALARSLKLSQRVRLIESSRLASPIAFGLIWPAIGLPLNFSARFSAAKQEAMLTHELAHLAAHDPFWYLLADLAAALFWWHPAIWWLRRQLQLSSELAADEASLIGADGPRVLAECLVEMGGKLAKPFAGQLRVAGFRSDLGCRVQRLMRLEGNQWIPISRVRAAMAKSLAPIAVAATVILCTAWAVPRQLTKGDSMKTMMQNWQRALATFATIAAIQSPTVVGAQEHAAPPVAPTTEAGGTPPNPLSASQKEFYARRYGVPGAPTRLIPQWGLEAKLREIVLDEVKIDGLPLSEVLNFLSDESLKRDPEKKGINFLLNPNPPQTQPSPAGSVDPATGLPIAGPVELVDISSTSVKFNIPLRHVTMADVLDAIVRVADKPIQYAVEDYAVIFSLRADGNFMPQRQERAVGLAPLTVRTFHVDTNTFVAGLESAFGIMVETKGKGESQSRRIQSALKELLVQLNVAMDGNKAIYYNELTGTVMVRVAAEDVDVIQAAIETLGGQQTGIYTTSYGPTGPIPPGFERR